MYSMNVECIRLQTDDPTREYFTGANGRSTEYEAPRVRIPHMQDTVR